MSKHRTTVFLESDMLAAIRKVAKDDERPMAYHYDKALRAYGPIKKLAKAKAVAPLSKSDEMVLARANAKGHEVPVGINFNAWIEWLEAKKYKVTDAAMKKQWKLLLGYNDADQQTIIDASINSGWQGLFPLKGQQRPQESFTAQHTDDKWRDDL